MINGARRGVILFREFRRMGLTKQSLARSAVMSSILALFSAPGFAQSAAEPVHIAVDLREATRHMMATRPIRPTKLRRMYAAKLIFIPYGYEMLRIETTAPEIIPRLDAK